MRTMPVSVSTETSAICTPPTCSLVRPSFFGPSPVVSMPIMPSSRQAERFGQNHRNAGASAGADVLRAAERFDAAVWIDADGAGRRVSLAAPSVNGHAESFLDRAGSTFAVSVPLLRPADEFGRSF